MSEKKSKITVYYPNQRFDDSFFTIWKTIFWNVTKSKDLIYQLFKRDFFAQYKKSFIGSAWAFITPIFGIASWVLMQFTGVLNPGELDVPYPIYVLLGSSSWGFFISMVNAGSGTLLNGQGLIHQIKYPHEAILFKQILVQIVNFLISLSIIIVVISFFGYYPSLTTLLFPILLIPVILIGTSLGLLLSIISVVAVDLSRLTNYLLSFMIYTAPIIYSDKIENELLQAVNTYNPLTYIVCSIRDIILFGNIYGDYGYLYSVIFSVIVFTFVWIGFFRNEDKVVERII